MFNEAREPRENTLHNLCQCLNLKRGFALIGQKIDIVHAQDILNER